MDRQFAMKAVAGFALELSFAALGNAQQVWVVSQTHGPGVFSQEILPAIDAATTGDIVLVKASGTYPYYPFNLTKGLSVVAEAGASVRANGTCYVSIGTSTSSAYLRGISFAWIDVIGCGGPVWIENCSAFTTSILNPNGVGAFNIGDSASLALLHCPATGMGGVDGGTMDPSLVSVNSNVYARDCSFI